MTDLQRARLDLMTKKAEIFCLSPENIDLDFVVEAMRPAFEYLEKLEAEAVKQQTMFTPEYMATASESMKAMTVMESLERENEKLKAEIERLKKSHEEFATGIGFQPSTELPPYPKADK